MAMDKNNVIFQKWKTFATLTNERQREYFKQKMKDGHTIKCVSIRDVFTDEEIKQIKSYCMVEQNMCFRTAYRLTNIFPKRVKYVEGEVTIFNGALGIEHAWNLVDGCHYIDLTFELALSRDVTKETYVALGAYDVHDISKVAGDTQVYGGVYDYLLIKKIKEKERKTKKH